MTLTKYCVTLFTVIHVRAYFGGMRRMKWDLEIIQK